MAIPTLHVGAASTSTEPTTQAQAELSGARAAITEFVPADAMQWSTGPRCTGPRDALIKAGLVPPGTPFPGDRPGRARCNFVMPDGRRASLSKAKGGAFGVLIPFTDAERAARSARARQSRDQADAQASRLAEAKAAQLEAARVAALPSTHGAFRNAAASTLWMYISLLRAQYFSDGHQSGFGFTASAGKEFDALAAQLYFLVKDGQTALDTRHQALPLAEARGKAARLDLPLQQFLQRAAEPLRTDRSDGPDSTPRR